MDFPPNFDRSWDQSDVVLLADDTEGNEKELHANRTYLSFYSSFFKRMFFSDFKEANSDRIKVLWSCEIMKLILEIIHAFSRDFGTNESHEIGVLMELYKAADYMDFPAIRKMCIQQMINRPSLEMATAVLGVASIGDGLHETVMDIPKDFDIKWGLSDIVLFAEDAEGNEKELHASKVYLGTHSSFFNRIFFSGFKEANSESLKVSCDYETLKLILQIIYELSHDFSVANQVLEIGILPKLYKAADYFDFPAIRKMCTQQMSSRPSLEMATAILSVASVGEGLHDILMGILEKLSPDDIKKFLSIEDSQLLFSKKDVRRIYKAITKKLLRHPNATYDRWTTERLVPDLSENNKNIVVDCTEKWPRSDVMLKTKNSDGKELYSNKTVLAMVSSHFANLFFGSPGLETTDLTEIEVNVDYMIMKNILAIIHHCYDNYNLVDLLLTKSFTLYNMYSAASKENLDIPIVRSTCVKTMMESADEFRWELATSLKLEADERLLIVKNIDSEGLCCWLFNYTETVTSDYFSEDTNKSKYLVYYISEKKPIVSTTEVDIMIEKLLAGYNKEL